MHLTLFESISVNGMIGRPDGGSDFFTDYCWTGFVELARRTGAVIWGRTTHDLIRGWNGPLQDLAGVELVVLTRDEKRTGWSPAG